MRKRQEVDNAVDSLELLKNSKKMLSASTIAMMKIIKNLSLVNYI